MKIDVYYIGYPKTASTSLELAFHFHPEIQQGFRTRLFDYCKYSENIMDNEVDLYNQDKRIIVESDESLISNVFRDYLTVIERARKHNEDLKILITLRSQVARLYSAYLYYICGDPGFMSFRKWSKSMGGQVQSVEATTIKR